MEQGCGEPRTENLDGEVRDMITTLGKLAAVGFVAALAAAQLAPTPLSDLEKHSLWGGCTNNKCKCLQSCATPQGGMCFLIVDLGCKAHPGSMCNLTAVKLCDDDEDTCAPLGNYRATNDSQDCPSSDRYC